MNIINIGYHSTNYYAIANDKRPILLVDAGWPSSLPEMRHAASRMGIRLEDIQYQISTHYHPDHAGLVEELKHLGIKHLALNTQIPSISLLATYVKPRDNFTPINLATSTIITIEQSRDFLATIRIQGEIISTPGHSDDSITLILDDPAAAFTGDLTNPTFISDDKASLSYQSWQQIRVKGVTTIYPGHGPSWQL